MSTSGNSQAYLSKEKVVKITAQDKSFMKLIQRSNVDADGWCSVSKTLYPYFSTNMRADLATFEPVGEAGRCRLTPLGQSLLDAMIYL